jgi:hypothetical protein
MSYLGRALRNKFPLWSETRRNESSNGSMILNAIGESIEDERVSFLKSTRAINALQGAPAGEFSQLFTFIQPDIAQYKTYVRNNSIFESLLGEATLGNELLPLTANYDYSSMSLAYPTRVVPEFLHTENTKLLSITPSIASLSAANKHFQFISQVESTETYHICNDTFDFKNEHKKIYVEVTGSLVFDNLVNNETFNNHYSVILRGYDEADNKVEETIEIHDDGHYESKTWFKCLCPLIQENAIRGGGSIERYGFDGTLSVSTAPVHFVTKLHKDSTIIKVSNELGYNTLIENGIKFKLVHDALEPDNIDSANVSSLEYVFRSYSEGKDYKLKGAELPPSFFEETLSKRTIVNNSLEPIQIEDFCIDAVRNKFITINKDFILRYYAINRDSFLKKNIKRTRQVDLCFEAENQHVQLNETGKMHVFLERAKSAVDYVIVGRQTPDRRISYLPDSDFNFEFLQEDMTWSDDFNYFEGESRFDRFENFDTLEFYNTYDEPGQYDFYVISLRGLRFHSSDLDSVKTGAILEEDFKIDVLKNLNDPHQQEVYINSYSVLCEEMTPELELPLDVNIFRDKLIALGHDITVDEYSLSVWYEDVENTLKVSVNINDNNFIFLVNCFYDYIFYDYITGEGVTIEAYDTLDLTVNDTYVSSLTYGGSEIVRRRNSVWIDEVGFKYGITRELEEPLNAYRHRIYKAVSGTLNQEKYSFYKSLGYITAMSDLDIFSIDKVDPAADIKIIVTANRIRIWLDDVLKYQNRFDSIRFLSDLKTELELLDFITVTVLPGNDEWFYKRTSNLMPATTEREFLNLMINSQSQQLPYKHVVSVHDRLGNFLRNVDEALITNPHNYSLKDNVLHKYGLNPEVISFEYQDFPFILKWLPIKGCAVNDSDFEDLLKMSFDDNENYGVQSAVVENKATEKVLSQEGSVIINKILNKQNTYWGK